jgi:hypothetical protein
MTPSPAAPAAASGGDFTSASSMMDSLLDSPSESSTPEPKQAAPEPPAVKAEPVAEPVAEEVEQEAAPEPNYEDEVDQEEVIDQEGRKYYNVKPQKMAKFVAANKAWTQISEFAPTVEDARAHYESSSDFRALQSDFASGEPEGVQNFMGYWSKGAPEAFQTMATQMLPYLAKLAGSGDPGFQKVISAIESQVHRATITSAYDKARQTGDPKDLYAAQAIDFAINGKFVESVDKIPVRQTRQIDHTQQREQQLNQRETEFANRHWQEFDSTAISGAKESALTSSVEAAFRPFESVFAGSPRLLAAAKRDAIAEVQKEIAGKHFEWKRNQELETNDIKRDLIRSVKAGQKTDLGPRAAALVQDYRNKVSNTLPRIVKELIGEQTRSVVQQSAKTHESLARGAGKTSPGAGGKAVPRDIFPTPNWKSTSEGLDALLGT